MKEFFGKCNNQDTYLYTLENDNVSFSVTDYGATLVSLVDKKTNIDVVLGHDNVEGYMNNTYYFGASIGRVANRIRNGVFTLNGKEYHLPINQNGNHLHGGICGFDKKIWQTEEKENEIIFSYLSKDNEEGYPGNLQVQIIYRLLDDGVAIISKGESDQDTLFAYTNHAYFNIDGEGEINDQVVETSANQYVPCDENFLAQDEIRDVEGTAFDFRKPKELGVALEADDPQIKIGDCIDQHFIIEGSGMRKMVTCEGKEIKLEMDSDFPGFHIYTGYFYEPILGKNGVYYKGRVSVCFEAEYYPNGINYESVKDKPIVKANEELKHEIRYRFIEK